MKTRIRTEAAALWQIAWPVLIGQLATVGMGVADVAMTGHFNAEELAAVSLGTSLWTIVLVTVMGIMMAVNAVVSHEVGAEQYERVPHIVRQSLWLGLGVGLIACLLLNASTLSIFISATAAGSAGKSEPLCAYHQHRHACFCDVPRLVWLHHQPESDQACDGDGARRTAV
jgi:Na+-driven multidrug efflux pump